MYYGLVSQHHAIDIAIVICECLGFGVNNKAVEQLLETSAVETGVGSIQDRHPLKMGVGLPQIDKGTFDWLKAKYQKGRRAEEIYQRFGVKLAYVKYQELAYSPLLSLLFARLRYLTVTEPIPKSREERAHYWKAHYNSFHPNAKGTPEHYLTMCSNTLDPIYTTYNQL